MSRAVVVYIWGYPRRLPYPTAHPEDVVATFADSGPDLVAYVDAILSEAYAEPMELPGESLSDSARRIEAVISARHPELDEEAVRAVGTHFAYMTK